MRRWVAGLIVAMVVLASCTAQLDPTPSGTPTPPLVTLAPVGATAGTPTPIAVTPGPTPTLSGTPLASDAPRATPPGAGACRLSDSVTVKPPPSLVEHDGVVAGMTAAGELLVLQSHIRGVGDTLSVFDPRTRTVSRVVSRPVAKSQETATLQIAASVTGNADWILWQEVGFFLEHADWNIWAFERRTGKIRKVAAFDRGPDGLAAPGWASEISLLGDLAAWSAPAGIGGGRVGERIYVADLRAKTVRRLDMEARWPSFVSPQRLVAAMEVGTDAGGKVLAQPATIDPADGKATVQDWVPPARLLEAAAGPAGTVVARLLKESTADDSTAVADLLTHDPAGVTRQFALTHGWGPVTAGKAFVAWTDDRRLWILPAGQTEPTLLFEAPGDDSEDVSRVTFVTNGSTLLWRPLSSESGWDGNVMATVTCP